MQCCRGKVAAFTRVWEWDSQVQNQRFVEGGECHGNKRLDSSASWMLRGEITLMRVADASGGPETACLVRRQACDPRQGAWILRNVTGQQREMPAVPLVEAEKGALSSAAQPDSGRLSAQHSEKFRSTTWGNSLIQGFAPLEKIGPIPSGVPAVLWDTLSHSIITPLIYCFPKVGDFYSSGWDTMWTGASQVAQ